MGKDTAIEWTHHSFNGWWGCHKVSPECKNCYAATFDHRLGGDHWGLKSPRRFFGDKHWNEPLKWNREAERAGERRRVFCSSMADVFEDRDDLVAQRARLWVLIRATPHLDWLLLTKRPENLLRMLPWTPDVAPWPNVWVGTSVGCNETLWRLGELAKIDAVVRFVSAEPLLEVVSFANWLARIHCRGCGWIGNECDAIVISGLRCPKCNSPGLFHRRKGLLDWVIAGGESGHGARAMLLEAARLLRDECVAAGVAFLFKQWGEHDDGYVCIGKKAAGRLLDGRTWDGYPTPRRVP